MRYVEQEAKALVEKGVPREEITTILRLSAARLEQVLLGCYVVRVVHPVEKVDPLFFNFLECLRRADIVRVHRDGCFDILPPHLVLSYEWAERVAGIMESHDWNAVRAPRWPEKGE